MQCCPGLLERHLEAVPVDAVDCQNGLPHPCLLFGLGVVDGQPLELLDEVLDDLLPLRPCMHDLDVGRLAEACSRRWCDNLLAAASLGLPVCGFHRWRPSARLVSATTSAMVVPVEVVPSRLSHLCTQHVGPLLPVPIPL